jgi:hypothetical protein
MRKIQEIIKQLAAPAVLALALSGCGSLNTLNSTPARSATALVVTQSPHWCREHRFLRYDEVWHLHHCSFWGR